MHEEHLKLSQFLDNELDHKQSLQLMDKLASDHLLDEKFRRYGAVSQAIKTEVFLSLSDDFVSQVNEKIKAEPVYFLPQKNRRRYQILSYSAIAASLAIVSVILIKNSPPEALIVDNSLTLAQKPKSQPETASQQLIAKSQTQTPEEESIEMVAGERHMDKQLNGRTPRLQPVKPKFDDYLQAHSGNMYSPGANFQAYAQVANFEQE